MDKADGLSWNFCAPLANHHPRADFPEITFEMNRPSFPIRSRPLTRMGFSSQRCCGSVRLLLRGPQRPKHSTSSPKGGKEGPYLLEQYSRSKWGAGLPKL